MKRLIVNADDFGMSGEVNEGIKQGIEVGVITSVSVMVNMPYTEDAIMFLKKHPKTSVGLHFNITEGPPISGLIHASTLVREDGNFYHWKSLVINLLAKKTSMEEIQHELDSQYDRLKKAGLRIDHIDSHHHVHLFPAIYQLLMNFALRHAIMVLRSRTFRPMRAVFTLLKIGSLKQFIILSLYALNTLLRSSPKQMYEIDQLYDMNWDSKFDEVKFLNFLGRLPQGVTLIISHPAIMSKTGNPLFLKSRYKELRILLNKKVLRKIKQYTLDVGN